MNKKIEQLEGKLERVRKEEADTKIKNYINQEKDLEAQLFVAISEESGLSYQEMKELILPAQSSN